MDKKDKKVPDPTPCPACGVPAHVITEMTPGGVFIEELSCLAWEYNSQYLERTDTGTGSFWENRPVVCAVQDQGRALLSEDGDQAGDLATPEFLEELRKMT